MKVGILTWFSACNYGARAHSLALRKVVESLGHECSMISFYPKNDKRINFRVNVGTNHIYLHPFLMLKSAIRCHKFKKSISLNPVTKIVENGNDIDNLNLDVVILGSDEIFKVSHPTFDKIYYGVGINKTRKITYAPSSGQTEDNFNLDQDIKDSLKNIKYLSARDKHTASLIKHNIGQESTIVLDPTILYDFKSEAVLPKISDYLLIYAFDEWDEYKEQILDYAHKKKMKVVSLGRYRKWADINWDVASVEEWLGAFVNAKEVITDSFHGVVFATKNKKQFCLFSRSDKLNKINDFLDDAGISREYFSNNTTLEKYFENKIDFSKVEENLKTKIDKSINYLKKALSND